MLRTRIDWKLAGYLLSSPLVRSAALLPVFGYLIVFSTEVQGWLDMGVLGQQFVLSHELKLRLLYYGGVLVVVGLVIYALRCPPLIKKYKDESELHLAPTRVSASDELDRMIKSWIDISLSDVGDHSLDANFPYFAFGYCEQILHGSDRDFDRAIRRTDSLRFGRPRPRGPQHESSRDGLIEFLKSYFDKIKEENSRSEISDQETTHAVNALGIVNQMARVTRITGSALEIAHILYRIEFLRERFSRKFSAYLTVLLSGTGLMLMIVPAVETLLQIVLIDTGLLSHPEITE